MPSDPMVSGSLEGVGAPDWGWLADNTPFTYKRTVVPS